MCEPPWSSTARKMDADLWNLFMCWKDYMQEYSPEEILKTLNYRDEFCRVVQTQLDNLLTQEKEFGTESMSMLYGTRSRN